MVSVELRAFVAAMITPVECRQHAIECRQMAGRAPNSRVQFLLIDMARTWDRLAIEAEHTQTNAPAAQLIASQAARPVAESRFNDAENKRNPKL
jgi:hypothetical protein